MGVFSEHIKKSNKFVMKNTSKGMVVTGSIGNTKVIGKKFKHQMDAVMK